MTRSASWRAPRARCTLRITRTCSTQGQDTGRTRQGIQGSGAMVASIKPHRDELGLGDGLILINGQWTAAADGGTWSHIHPATGEQVASFPVASPADVDSAVRAARRAFDEGSWPNARANERVRVLR